MRHTVVFGSYDEMDEYYVTYTLPELPKGVEWMDNINSRIFRTALYISVNLNGYYWCIERKVISANMRIISAEINPHHGNKLGKLKLWTGGDAVSKFLKDLEDCGLRYLLKFEVEPAFLADVVVCDTHKLYKEMKDSELQVVYQYVREKPVLKKKLVDSKAETDKKVSKNSSKSNKKARPTDDD